MPNYVYNRLICSLKTSEEIRWVEPKSKETESQWTTIDFYRAVTGIKTKEFNGMMYPMIASYGYKEIFTKDTFECRFHTKWVLPYEIMEKIIKRHPDVEWYGVEEQLGELNHYYNSDGEVMHNSYYIDVKTANMIFDNEMDCDEENNYLTLFDIKEFTKPKRKKEYYINCLKNTESKKYIEYLKFVSFISDKAINKKDGKKYRLPGLNKIIDSGIQGNEKEFEEEVRFYYLYNKYEIPSYWNIDILSEDIRLSIIKKLNIVDRDIDLTEGDLIMYNGKKGKVEFLSRGTKDEISILVNSTFYTVKREEIEKIKE